MPRTIRFRPLAMLLPRLLLVQVLVLVLVPVRVQVQVRAPPVHAVVRGAELGLVLALVVSFSVRACPS